MGTTDNDEHEQAMEKLQKENHNSIKRIEVNVIVPVHNAGSTITEAVQSAMNQKIPLHLIDNFAEFSISIFVCCYDDASTDESWSLLLSLKERYVSGCDDIHHSNANQRQIASNLYLQSSGKTSATGAGYARNQAVHMRDSERNSLKSTPYLDLLCLLDSDDTMHANRVAEQVSYFLSLEPEVRNRTLLGCTFDRDPPDSTWHYSSWANELSDERLMLERFREITILQPTWMIIRSRFCDLGEYIVPPNSGTKESIQQIMESRQGKFTLIHPEFDCVDTLRLAEDLRFFHAHLQANGLLHLHRATTPLVTYRHSGTSQSFRTPRKLLLGLRVKAFEMTVLLSDPIWQHHQGSFIVWGAGRDGKDFLKALSPVLRKRVYCFADVDAKKIDSGYYVNRDLDVRIPIVHYSLLAVDPAIREQRGCSWKEGLHNDEIVGRINKSKDGHHLKFIEKSAKATKLDHATVAPRKKRKTHIHRESDLDLSILPKLPVVVCVAMYRTNGVLEDNVKSIGRKEGVNLWHFS